MINRQQTTETSQIALSECTIGDFAMFLDPGPPLRLEPDAVEAAVQLAGRARAFHDTIGALWRLAPRKTQPALSARDLQMDEEN